MYRKTIALICTAMFIGSIVACNWFSAKPTGVNIKKTQPVANRQVEKQTATQMVE